MTESVLDLLRKPDPTEEPTKETISEKPPTKIMTTKKTSALCLRYEQMEHLHLDNPRFFLQARENHQHLAGLSEKAFYRSNGRTF